MRPRAANAWKRTRQFHWAKGEIFGTQESKSRLDNKVKKSWRVDQGVHGREESRDGTFMKYNNSTYCSRIKRTKDENGFWHQEHAASV